MIKRKIAIIFFIGVILILSPLLAAEAPYTLEDRDRLINVEVTLKELRISQDR